MSDLCVFLGGFAVEVGVVRRGGAPLPGLRGQPGGETFFWEQIEGSLSGSSCRKVGDLIEVFVQVLMPIPKPTGFTGADPYKM
jgi:hypothetical protein